MRFMYGDRAQVVVVGMSDEEKVELLRISQDGIDILYVERTHEVHACLDHKALLSALYYITGIVRVACHMDVVIDASCCELLHGVLSPKEILFL